MPTTEIREATLLTIPEVAKLLRVNTARAYELARTGAIPSVRLGRQVRVSHAALLDLIHGRVPSRS